MNKFSLYVPDVLTSNTEYFEAENIDQLKLALGGSCIAACATSTPDMDYVYILASENEIYLRLGRAGASDEELLAIIRSPGFSETESKFPYGQYCVAYINKRTANTLIITDLLGIRGLFTRRVESSGWLICSHVFDIKTLCGLVAADLDDGSCSFLMRYAYLKKGTTLYREVRELAPARVYTIESGVIKQHDKVPAFMERPFITTEDYVESLHNCIESVVKDQIGRGKRKAGVLLGGFDSALVAAYLVRAGVEVEAFTFSYADSNFNQPFIKETCEFLGIKQHWVHVDAELFGSELMKYSSFCNHPTVWPGYVLQTKFLCEEMLKHDVQVCFSGDGCDTLFMGYPSTYRRGYIYQNMPRINKKVSEAITYVADNLGFEYLFGHVYRVFRSLLNAAIHTKDDRPFYSFQVFNDWSLRRLGIAAISNNEDNSQYLHDLAENNIGVGYFRKMYLAKSLISPNRQKIIASSNASGLSIESPYMHPMLKKFASSIPESCLRIEGRSVSDEGKELLMQMAEKYSLLPVEVIRQKKLAAIVSPIDQWYAKHLKAELLDYLKRKSGDVSAAYVGNLLDDLSAERIYKKYFSSDMVASLAISLLVTYATFT